jgi:putative hydrolase of HD superfamily
MDKKRFQEQMAFALEIDKEKNIYRQTHLSGHGRREDDAEHAWHMAVMAYLLKEYANEEVDILHVIMMCLVHDLVEIDAGDTYAYDEEGKKSQRQREEAAADRIFGLLPKDQAEEFRAMFEEFDAYETPEACFAHTMDNLQPMMLNDSNDGGDWVEHGVGISEILKRQSLSSRGSEEIGRYIRDRLEYHVKTGHIREDR